MVEPGNKCWEPAQDQSKPKEEGEEKNLVKDEATGDMVSKK